MRKFLEREDSFRLKEKLRFRYMSNYNCLNSSYVPLNVSYGNSRYSPTCYKKRQKTINNGWKIHTIRINNLNVHLLDINPLEKEQDNYLNKKDELIEEYNGKYIALVNGQVEDSDTNFSDLAKRIYAKFGYREIFMTLVTKEKKIHRLSPKFI